eukprot:scaffold316392_cov32-Prasinocladus_malaysianus.AAC.1
MCGSRLPPPLRAAVGTTRTWWTTTRTHATWAPSTSWTSTWAQVRYNATTQARTRIRDRHFESSSLPSYELGAMFGPHRICSHIFRPVERQISIQP